MTTLSQGSKCLLSCLNLNICFTFSRFSRKLVLFYDYCKTVHPPPPRSIHLHRAPPTYTQLHPLLLSSFNLKPSLCNTFNVIRTKILHVIRQFPKFRPKSCSFWLKVGMHSILEVMIRNPDIKFWSSGPKINF